MPLVSAGAAVASYAGVSFVPPYTSEFTMRPVPTTDGRTTKAVTYNFKIRKALIEPNPGDDFTDTRMLNTRRRLSQRGGELVILSKGFGDLVVNSNRAVTNPTPGAPAPATVRDLAFGPEPGLLSFTTFGDGVNAAVDWDVSTTIPECDSALYVSGIAELSYKVVHQQDRDGYATISTSGRLEIPMTRIPGSQAVPDHVDRYKERLQTPVPEGFQRLDEVFDYSSDKRVIEFSWKDEQIREPLPISITTCPLTCSVHADAKDGFTHHRVTVQGTITCPPNMPKEYCARVFMVTALDRYVHTVSQPQRGLIQRPGRRDGRPVGLGQGAGGALSGVFGLGQQRRNVLALPLEFNLVNEIGGRAVRGSLTWEFYQNGDLLQILEDAGTWRPFPRTSWGAWRDSLRQLGVTTVRGTAGLVFNPAADTIIDLCHQQRPAREIPGMDRRPRELPAMQRRPRELPAMRRGPRQLPGMQRRTPVVQVSGGAGEDLDPTQIQQFDEQDDTWLVYHAELDYQEPRGRYAYHQPLAGALSEPREGYNAAGPVGAVRGAAGGTVGSAVWQGSQAILQEVGPPRPVVILRGYAVRIGDHTPLPMLLSAQGFRAVRNRIIRNPVATVGLVNGGRLTRSEFEIEFFLTTPPRGRLPSLADPVLGLSGGT